MKESKGCRALNLGQTPRHFAQGKPALQRRSR